MITASKLLISSKGILEFVERKMPTLDKRQALVRGIISGISHATELAVLNEATPTFHKHWNDDLRCFTEGSPSKTYPSGLGYEYVGEVIEIGKGVTDLEVGDIVWMDAPHQTFNVLDVDKTPFLKLSGKKDVKRAAFLALTRIALAGVHDAQPKIGDSFFVSGLGTIGLIVVQLLKKAGVRAIYASDPLAFRRKKAQKFGAIVVNPAVTDAGVFAKQKSLRGVDAAIECSGSSKALHDAVKACGIGGRVISVATYREGAANLFLGEEWHRNRITMVSSMSVNGCPHREYPLWNLSRLNMAALHLLQEKHILVEEMITQSFAFEEAKKAYACIQEKPNETLKVVLTYS